MVLTKKSRCSSIPKSTSQSRINTDLKADLKYERRSCGAGRFMTKRTPARGEARENRIAFSRIFQEDSNFTGLFVTYDPKQFLLSADIVTISRWDFQWLRLGACCIHFYQTAQPARIKDIAHPGMCNGFLYPARLSQ
jgi:hypothetical protein